MRVFNTYSRKVEEFVPLDQNGKTVSMYTCGPTVYSRAHIGNFRAYVFEDLLQRHLELRGYNVRRVMNLTDVDDKTIRGARQSNVPLDEFTAPFKQAFFDDLKTLQIKPADEFPAATDQKYIERMISMIQTLVQRGLAYQAEDKSVYFRISKFPDYGKLAHIDLTQLQSTGRVQHDEYDKEHIGDFALWKAWDDQDGDVGWESPWGCGRPGWHIECSAMATALLGDQIDIHCGGVDNIFPHHEDEIAQSCAFTGQVDFARIWMHGEFLNVRGQKMSKRYGNYTTPRDLREDGVDPGALRLLFFQTHYRQKLDLTDEALAASREGARRLGGFARRLQDAAGQGVESGEFVALAEKLDAGFREALDDDLNAPRAVAAAFDFVSEGNRLLDQGQLPGPRAVEAWRLVDSVLDASTAVKFTSTGSGVDVNALLVLPETPPAGGDDALDWARHWAEARVIAKAKKDFSEADRIRKLLADHGFEVRDSRNGSEVVRK